jgi:signal transduction histidine kinase
MFELLNERLVEAIFYGVLVLIPILIFIVFYVITTSQSQKQKLISLKNEFEKTQFELDFQVKQFKNQENKSLADKKNLEDVLKKNQELEVIFSEQNIFLEREVRKQTQEIRETNTKLTKVVDELDTFIYRTAHDIRGPLARLLGLSQVALLDVKEATAINYIQKIGFEADNLNNILARLSVIYEINHGDLRKEEINPETLAKTALAEIATIEGFNQVQFNVHVQENMVLYCDIKLLRFILRNLIENAIRFRRHSSDVSSFVKIDLEQTKKSYVIRVIDNGIGVSPTDALVIFEMFTRAAGVHKTTGLGLYLTKLSVEKLEGDISLVTDDGLTEFRVTIPC